MREIIGNSIFGDDTFSHKTVARDLHRIADYNEDYWRIKDAMLRNAKEGYYGIEYPRAINAPLADILKREGFSVVHIEATEEKGAYTEITW